MKKLSLFLLFVFCVALSYAQEVPLEYKNPRQKADMSMDNRGILLVFPEIRLTSFLDPRIPQRYEIKYHMEFTKPQKNIKNATAQKKDYKIFFAFAGEDALDFKKAEINGGKKAGLKKDAQGYIVTIKESDLKEAFRDASNYNSLVVTFKAGKEERTAIIPAYYLDYVFDTVETLKSGKTLRETAPAQADLDESSFAQSPYAPKPKEQRPVYSLRETFDFAKVAGGKEENYDATLEISSTVCAAIIDLNYKTEPSYYGGTGVTELNIKEVRTEENECDSVAFITKDRFGVNNTIVLKKGVYEIKTGFIINGPIISPVRKEAGLEMNIIKYK